MQDQNPWSDKELLHLSSVREIFGGFAHEVAQPLNAIMIASQVVQLKVERSPLSHEEKSFVNQRLAIVSEQVQRATQLVEGLRQFVAARMSDAGPANLKGTYERVHSLMHQQFIGRGIEIAMEAVPGFEPLKTDCHVVEAVLVHCLSYARDSLEAIAQWHENVRIPFQRSASVGCLTSRGASVLRVQWRTGKLPENQFAVDPEARMGLVTARSVLRSEGGDLRILPASVVATIP
jgi:nitrogen-specific signal transduction histidine kinase